MRVVAKVGTSSITDDHGAIDRAAIAKVTREIAEVREQGHEVLLVSSGAVAAGIATLGFDSRPADVRTLQAVSAVGQSRIMGVWNEELDAFMHLWTVNRGVLLAPFHNMSLFSQFHTDTDVDRHTSVFAEAVAALAP